jgi:hypothetical protein
VTVIAGPPIDLSRWAGAEPTMETLTVVTDEIMLRLRDMLADIRGAPPPPLWSPASRQPKPGTADGSQAVDSTVDLEEPQ